jgi:large subunit ribosomal protein L18Ae
MANFVRVQSLVCVCPPSHHIFHFSPSYSLFLSFYKYQRMTVAGLMRQYQVVGRKAPTDDHPNPEAYRMIIFAPNPVIAKSKFWYYMHQFRKMKKTTGEILDCVELVEKNARIVKNYGIWLRYSSRSGTHNMYREFRDVSLTGAVSQLYDEMAGRHRTRPRSIQIIRTATVTASALRRTNPMQFAKAAVKFPLPHRVASGKRGQKALSDRTYSTVRPTTYFG